MKQKIIIGMVLLSLILSIGCSIKNRENSNSCDIGLFPSDADKYFCIEQAEKRMEECLSYPKYTLTTNGECHLIINPKGCNNYIGITNEFTKLPKNWKNISDKAYLSYYCTGFEKAGDENSCETVNETFSYYRLIVLAKYEPLEICWD